MDRGRLYEHKLQNLRHSLLLLGGMGLLLAAMGWLLAGPEGVLWTLILGMLTLILSPQLSARAILRLYGARPIHPREAPDIYRVVVELARRAELSEVPTLFYLPSRIMNAFTVGQRGDAAITVSDGLLRRLSMRELAGVLAHEISHVRNNDMWVMGLADVVSRLTNLLSLVSLLILFISLPLLLVSELSISLWPLLLLIAAPSISALLQLALARTREYDADLDAAMLTGDPRGLAAALDKLERYQGGWLERVLMPGRHDPVPSLLRTHPPTEERIRRLLVLLPPTTTVIPSYIRFPSHGIFPGGTHPPIMRTPRWHIGGFWH